MTDEVQETTTDSQEREEDIEERESPVTEAQPRRQVSATQGAARYDEDYEEDEYDEEDVPPADETLAEYEDEYEGLGGEVDGPAQFSPSERRGGRRAVTDVRLEDIDYKRIQVLTRFIDNRGRILPRRKTRVSAKMQRRVTQAVKRARHLALLPYTAEHVRITRKR